MAKNKISEWSATPANNTDVGGIDIAEGCAPSGINNAIREIMAQVKDMQSGADGDSFTCSGTLVASGTLDITGGMLLDNSAGTSGQVLVSAGSGNTPTWGNSFVSGMIMLWSGSSASIPSGWLLCNGSNSTPDLRNRFVVGAGDTYAVGATGGSANAITVAHTHTGTTNSTSLTGSLQAQGNRAGLSGSTGIITNDGTVTGYAAQGTTTPSVPLNFYLDASHTHGFTTDSTGSSGTNANLPPYYALCYIMKS